MSMAGPCDRGGLQSTGGARGAESSRTSHSPLNSKGRDGSLLRCEEIVCTTSVTVVADEN